MCLGALGDVLDFKVFQGEDMLKAIGDDPLRFLLTGPDTFSTKIWDTVTGKNDQPLVDPFGGASSAVEARARAAGINTGPGMGLEKLGDVIAGAFAGDYFAGALGGVGSAGDAVPMTSSQTAAIYSDVGYTGEGTAAAVPSAGIAAPAVSGTSAGGGTALKYGVKAAEVFGPTLLQSALQPKPPKAPAPLSMPDPLAQEEARRRALIEQMARRGRASTILSQPSGKLGG